MSTSQQFPPSYYEKANEEEAFKDSSAGSFPTGLFGYRYVNPLTAPSGTKYEKGNAEDMLDAIAAGDVVLSPYFAAEGQQPGCGIEVAGFGVRDTQIGVTKECVNIVVYCRNLLYCLLILACVDRCAVSQVFDRRHRIFWLGRARRSRNTAECCE